MNNFFDYVFIRIFLWYESFKDGASFATAKLLIVYLQIMTVLNLVAIVSHFFIVTNSVYKAVALISALVLFLLASKKFPDKKIIPDLIGKWRNENKFTRVVKGYGIVFLLVGVLISFIVIVRW